MFPLVSHIYRHDGWTRVREVKRSSRRSWVHLVEVERHRDLLERAVARVGQLALDLGPDNNVP